MADNVGYTPGTGATIAADEISGVLHQRVKIGIGTDGSATDVSSSNPMPVTGTVTANTGLSQPLTDAQLRASAVPVSGTFFQATQPVSIASSVAVTGPLTDGQLRATPVPVSGTVTANTGLTQPLTDAQLRATPVPVSGTFFQATQPVSAASLPLPSGAATETTLSSIDGKLGSLGQKTMANSTPVVIASDQSAIPITGSITASNPSVGTTGSAVPASGTLIGGTDGTNLRGIKTDASGELQVDVLSSALPAGAATSANQAPLTTTHPLPNASGAVVRQAPAEIWSVGFAAVGSSLLATELTQRRLGTGVGVSQSASNLVVTSGTTANSEYLARSVQSFRGALTARHKTILSQRIANNNFAVMLADKVGEGLSCTINSATSITVTLTAHGFTSENVGQSMMVGAINGANGVPGRYAIASIPSVDTINFTVAGWPASGSCTVDLFGWNYLWTQYTGTTATNAGVDAQRRGWNSGNTTATINTTASPGHVMQTYADGRNVNWADSLVASSTTPTVTTRGSRIENIPDDDTELYLYLWLWNGTTNPASTTTWTIGFLSVEDNANVPTYIAGVRPNGAQAALSVGVVGTVTTSFTQPALVAGTAAIGDVGVQYRANATGAASGTHLVSAATTNATVVKGSAGRVLGWFFINTNAAIRYVKLHNQTTTPTAGTGVVRTIGIPANGVASFTLEGGIAFSTGIALTTVTGAADADNTAVGLNDIIGDIFFA
jgi:hypothetical protein